MIISSNGIVLNEYSDILLVQRDDTRTLAPPGGACEIDEMPPDAAAREVREETGLLVYPVRLVGLHYLPTGSEDFLFLSYRCIQRGGELAPSSETPQAGFFATNSMPGPMLPFHREQIDQAFRHSGGPPFWAKHHTGFSTRFGLLLLNRLVYPWLRFRRARSGQPAYEPPPDWQVRATLVVSSKQGETLLVHEAETDTWKLPISLYANSDPPWMLADQLNQHLLNNHASITGLSGICLRAGEPRMDFVFTGNLVQEHKPLIDQGKFFASDSLPENLHSEQRLMISDALKPGDQVSYRLLE